MNRHVLASLVLIFVFPFVVQPTNGNAAILGTNTIQAMDPLSGGEISITSTIYDNYSGDFSKYQFDYFVENISFDPTPGTSNGLSGYQVIFAGAVPGVADQYAPAAWSFNCCGTSPPFGAEADIDNTTGFGIPIGASGSFGFSTPAGVAWTDAFTGSWAHSWENDLQANTFDQIDQASGLSILTPLPGVPEPASTLVWCCLLPVSGLLLRRRRAR